MHLPPWCTLKNSYELQFFEGSHSLFQGTYPLVWGWKLPPVFCYRIFLWVPLGEPGFWPTVMYQNLLSSISPRLGPRKPPRCWGNVKERQKLSFRWRFSRFRGRRWGRDIGWWKSQARRTSLGAFAQGVCLKGLFGNMFLWLLKRIQVILS